MMRSIPVALVLLFAAAPAAGQLSGYVSGGFGYNTNPLYNFEVDGDQVAQTYLELAWTEESPSHRFRLGYVSGWMIFNKIAERNYYEHNLLAGYSLSLEDPPSSYTEDEPQVFRDGSLPGLYLGLKAGGRHDRSAFREFDNYGGELTGRYGMPIAETGMVSIELLGGYRHYVYLEPLSNLIGTLTARIGSRPGKGWEFGLRTSSGLKYFTTSLYDTTVFEPQRTFVLKAPGKGKGGARIRVPSDKKILVDAESNSIIQLAGGLYGGFSWDESSVRAELLYRHNPGTSGRYLAQYTNSSILNEDIYHDHFSYEGPDLTLNARHIFPARIQTILTLQYQRKVFTAPAFDLTGVEAAADRRDLRFGAELWVSRYFELFDGLGMDVAAAATLVRNQSNDMYNDFHVTAFSLFLGFGF